jgi:two-component system C4-dicarboxylate transport sensor histidine kinase DctB
VTASGVRADAAGSATVIASTLGAAHARFARAAIAIQLAVAAIALLLLVGMLTTERSHEEHQLRESLLLATKERERHFSRYLALLVQELRRLGLRSEVDLLDENLAPEKSLLRLSHQSSTFFNLGVAILGLDGKVVWAEPESFLTRHPSFADKNWFRDLERSRALMIVPVDPERAEDSVLYVVSPIVRDNEFGGALLGALDLRRGEELGGDQNRLVQTVLATRGGEIVYPPRVPDFARDPGFAALFPPIAAGASVLDVNIAGRPAVVTASLVPDTDLVFLLLADQEALLRPARSRLHSRLAFALTFAAAPLLLLVVLLRRSLRTFRQAEERFMREERLRRVGEAANLIAHEVKNSLNGIRMAAEMACSERTAGRDSALQQLRGEIVRLSDFTAQLMTFSKGVAPRRVRIDLCEFVPKVMALQETTAVEAGVSLTLSLPSSPLLVPIDPQLLHIVLTNLVVNAIEAVLADPDNTAPFVAVALSAHETSARIEVRDNGPGVPADIAAQLFEPFRSGKPNGVGIGLAMSKRIVLAHDGDLVQGPAASGASFVITLPLSVARDAPAPSQALRIA